MSALRQGIYHQGGGIGMEQTLVYLETICSQLKEALVLPDGLNVAALIDKDSGPHTPQGWCIVRLQEDGSINPVNSRRYETIRDLMDGWRQEAHVDQPDGELERFEKEYLEKNRDEIVSVYDRHAGLVDGARWQKQQLMKDAVDGRVEEPECFLWRVISDDLTGEFVVKNKLQDGDKVKLILAKED